MAKNKTIPYDYNIACQLISIFSIVNKKKYILLVDGIFDTWKKLLNFQFSIQWIDKSPKVWDEIHVLF